VCCSVLQRVAACCSVLQRVAVCDVTKTVSLTLVHVTRQTGEMLYDYARGTDGRKWEPRPVRKSVGAQVRQYMNESCRTYQLHI